MSIPRARHLSPWTYLGPYRLRVMFGMAMLVATNLLFLATPVLLGEIIDALKGADPAGEIPRLALAMVGFALLTAVTRIGSRVALFNTARMAEYDLRSDLFSHLLRFEQAFFRKHSTGDVMSRLTSDVQTVRALWGPGVLNVVNTIVAFASVLIMMVRVDPWLTLWAMLPYPSMVLFGRLFSRRLYRSSRAVQEQLGSLTSSIQEDLTGIGIIKSYTLEKPRRDKFRGMSLDLLGRNMALTNVRGQLVPVLTGLAGLSVVVVLWVGGRQVIAGEITLGQLVEFESYLARLVWPTLALGWMMSLFQRGLASWKRLEELFLREPAIVDGAGEGDDGEGDGDEGGKRGVGAIQGQLEIRNLTIEVDGRVLLDDVSLTCPAGSVTALVGRTGSGKTTLVEAIPRLIDIPAGTVFLDGRDVTAMPLSALRNAIGYAPQEAFLFSTSIADNIAFGYQRGEPGGAPDGDEDGDEDGGRERGARATPRAEVPVGLAIPGADTRAFADGDAQAGAARGRDRRLVTAAEAAGLFHDLAALPAGYDTLVGERGITLSGGQRQRVALARALATSPRVLLLDDSLSSVDAQTEREILEHLTALMKGRTAILISHRVAAVKRADQIAVLDEGRVIEVGTHDELLARGGVYSEVYQSQLVIEEAELASALSDARTVRTGDAGESSGPGADPGAKR